MPTTNYLKTACLLGLMTGLILVVGPLWAESRGCCSPLWSPP